MEYPNRLRRKTLLKQYRKQYRRAEASGNIRRAIYYRNKQKLNSKYGKALRCIRTYEA